jgi:NAD(P)-dependent dehydrogenase (short-subunit alcohol dehydrogenase family)
MLTDLLTRLPEAMKEVVRDQPIGRLGRPEEIAAAVLWLCSPAATFVIGAALAVDGGFTAHQVAFINQDLRDENLSNENQCSRLPISYDRSLGTPEA